MPTCETSITLNAPLEAVTALHADTSALKILNSPFIIVQLHRVDPMADGSISEFTLWMGPLPIRWRAIHSDVGPNGFTDSLDDGPMATWRHTHRFEALMTITPKSTNRSSMNIHLAGADLASEFYLAIWA